MKGKQVSLILLSLLVLLASTGCQSKQEDQSEEEKQTSELEDSTIQSSELANSADKDEDSERKAAEKEVEEIVAKVEADLVPNPEYDKVKDLDMPERIEREEEYIVGLINTYPDAHHATKESWEENLQWLVDHYDQLKEESKTKDINMFYVIDYIRSHETAKLDKYAPDSKS